MERVHFPRIVNPSTSPSDSDLLAWTLKKNFGRNPETIQKPGPMI
jgi:hypothetical protein